MNGALALGLVLALAASLALNGSYLLQHAGSEAAPAISPLRPLATLRALFASPLWVGGAALGMTGWGLHIAALSHAPLSLVQAFVAGGLILAVPFATGVLGHRLSAAERAGVALMAASLALLAVGIGRAPAHTAFSPAALGAYLASATAIAAALALAPVAIDRGPALGLAGGLLYGAADTAIKTLTSTAGHGAGALLRSPWLAVAALTTAGAFFAFQRGLQTGRALPVIALMTAGTNLVSILGGLLILGDPLGRTPALAALHGLAFFTLAVAAWRLAPTQAALATGQPAAAAGGDAAAAGWLTRTRARARRRAAASRAP